MAKRKPRKKKLDLEKVKKQELPDFSLMIDAASKMSESIFALKNAMNEMRDKMREQYTGLQDRVPVFFETSNDPFSERDSMSVQEYINKELRDGMVVSPDRNFQYELELQSQRRMWRQGMEMGLERQDYSREIVSGDLICPICGVYRCGWWMRYREEYRNRSREEIQKKHETIDLKEGVDYQIITPKQISNG